MEKLTIEEWSTYIGLHDRVIGLVEALRGVRDEFIVPLRSKAAPQIDIWSGHGLHLDEIDMTEIIHDPARDRANLIAKIEAMIAEAGEAGAGLAVVESEPAAGMAEPVVSVRFTGLDREGDRTYELNGGPFRGTRVFWDGDALVPTIGMAAQVKRELERLTKAADRLRTDNFATYLAACIGTWTLVE